MTRPLECERCFHYIKGEPWKVNFPGKNSAFTELCGTCYEAWKEFMEEFLKNKEENGSTESNN